MKGFNESCEEVTSVAEILLHDGHEEGANGFEDLGGSDIGSCNVVEAMLGPVHNDRLAGVAGAEMGEICEIAYLTLNRSEIEREAEAGGEIGEAAAGGLEILDCGSYTGDADRLDRSGAGGEDVEEAWPLEALHNVEVDDVHAVTGLQCLEDGLVGCEV